MVSYPYLIYTGLTPECREIIVANLADTRKVQKVIRLPDGMQLQNLSRSCRDDRIYFKAFEPRSGYVRVYELCLKFPFKKSDSDDHHNISMR